MVQKAKNIAGMVDGCGGPCEIKSHMFVSASSALAIKD
jgi:hypothetical protein